MFRLWLPWVLLTGTVIGLTIYAAQEAPPIRGSVADVNGNPLASVHVALEREFGEGLLLEYPQWDSIFSSSTLTAEDGSFLIPDPGKKGRYHLRANHLNFSESKREIERGEQGVTMTMHPGWSISGRVLWDKEFSEKGMYVAVHSKAKDWGDLEYSTYVYPSANGDFEIHGIAEGSYSLSVFPDHNGKALYQRPLKLTAGGGSKQVGIIDLQGELGLAVIKLIADTDNFFPAWASDTEGVQLGWCEGDTIQILFKDPPAVVIIHARGYRDVELKNLDGNREVPLTKGIPVEFSFDLVPWIPMDWMQEVELVLQAEDGSQLRGSGIWGGPSYSLTDYGELFLPTPGTYKVMMGLRKITDEKTYASAVTYFSTQEDAPSIVVLDQTEVQNFHVPINRLAAMAAILRLRNLEE